MVALSPWAILLILTKGVFPMDNELSSKNFAMSLSSPNPPESPSASSRTDFAKACLPAGKGDGGGLMI
jgi:hypothetical protein